MDTTNPSQSNMDTQLSVAEHLQSIEELVLKTRDMVKGLEDNKDAEIAILENFQADLQTKLMKLKEDWPQQNALLKNEITKYTGLLDKARQKLGTSGSKAIEASDEAQGVLNLFDGSFP